MTTSELIDWIEQSIEQNRSFALYRLPGEEVLYRITSQDGRVEVSSAFKSLNGKTGFVIAPFQITTHTPLVLIQGREEEISWKGHADTKAVPVEKYPVDEAYRNTYQAFISELRSGELEKVVLSRRIENERSAGFSPAMSFLRACERYIRSYVYICHTPQTGTWLGSTPEIILSGAGTNWHTVALAGTQPLTNGKLPEVWDDKNKEEQRLVAQYIIEQLETFSVNTSERGPYTVRAAELAHLKSDFSFTLPHCDCLGELLELLHPTPAVCGFPKEKAYRFILENEGYTRSYYSGFVGMLNAERRSNLYVNLRCMQIMNDKLYLYAGGGLLSSSEMEEEWQEIEDKLYTMRAII